MLIKNSILKPSWIEPDEALEDKIPEGDNRIEDAVVEGSLAEGRQPPKLAAGRQVAELGEQLLWVGAGRWRLGGGGGLARGVF